MSIARSGDLRNRRSAVYHDVAAGAHGLRTDDRADLVVAKDTRHLPSALHLVLSASSTKGSSSLLETVREMRRPAFCHDEIVRLFLPDDL